MHSDGTYESAYAWCYEACQPSDYGSFAERYEGCQQIEALVLDATAATGWLPTVLDAYVWANEGGMPGTVLAMLPDAHLGAVPFWPEVGRFIIELAEPASVAGVWWLGYWGDWPYSECGFYVGADLNGPGGGCPMTKIAPGQGYPEGWQNVSVAWGPTAALGIGAEVEEVPSPVEGETWGAIKSMFRE